MEQKKVILRLFKCLEKSEEKWDDWTDRKVLGKLKKNYCHQFVGLDTLDFFEMVYLELKRRGLQIKAK